MRSGGLLIQSANSANYNLLIESGNYSKNKNAECLDEVSARNEQWTHTLSLTVWAQQNCSNSFPLLLDRGNAIKRMLTPSSANAELPCHRPPSVHLGTGEQTKKQKKKLNCLIQFAENESQKCWRARRTLLLLLCSSHCQRSHRFCGITWSMLNVFTVDSVYVVLLPITVGLFLSYERSSFHIHTHIQYNPTKFSS